jgi:HAD superfamily hydrolase (TIGR01490 family)
MGRVAAIFDVDHTLVRGASERFFFLYLIRHQKLDLVHTLGFLARLSLHPRERFRDKSYLGGMEVEETRRLARQCFREVISPRLSPVGLACVRDHQARGHEIVLLTGSLSFLVEPLQEELGAKFLIATELAANDNHFTGKIQGLHPRGENKWLLLKELSREEGLDLASSYAYGDHIEDMPLFRSIGHPVAVNPGWRLKNQARRHRWPIRDF